MSGLQSETLRYLGYKGNTPDEQIAELVDNCLAELSHISTPRSLYKLCEVERGDSLLIATIATTSASLARHLDGCDRAVIFAATLGSDVDLLLRRSSLTDMSRTVVLQAAATALLEQYCDEVCGELSSSLLGDGLLLRPRFSPGYGDLALDCQRDILAILACSRIGLASTDSLMLTPSKSVTAIIGAGREPFCHRGGCESCGKTDCNFRRNDR